MKRWQQKGNFHRTFFLTQSIFSKLLTIPLSQSQKAALIAALKPAQNEAETELRWSWSFACDLETVWQKRYLLVTLCYVKFKTKSRPTKALMPPTTSAISGVQNVNGLWKTQACLTTTTRTTSSHWLSTTTYFLKVRMCLHFFFPFAFSFCAIDKKNFSLLIDKCWKVMSLTCLTCAHIQLKKNGKAISIVNLT